MLFSVFICLSFSEEFTDFFSGPTTHIYENVNDQRILLDPMSYFVKDSAFMYMTSTTYSTIHLFYIYPINLVVLDCVFYTCISPSHGGAIYFYAAEKGAMAMKRVCGSNCSTGNNLYGQFFYSYVPTNNNTLIQLVTVEKCANNPITKYAAISIYGGNSTFSELNISKCYTYQYSAMYSVYGLRNSFKYCTIYANSASHSYCYYAEVETFMNFTNIISNDSPSNYGVVSCHRHYYASDCIYMYNMNTLFYNPSYSTNLIRGWIKHQSTLNTGNIYTMGVTNTIVETPTIVINHYSTYGCNPQAMGQDLSPCQTIPHAPTPFQTIPPDCFISGSISEMRTLASLFHLIIITVLPFFLI